MKSNKAKNDGIVTGTPVNDVLSLLRRPKFVNDTASPSETAREVAQRIMEAARTAREAVSS